MSPTAMRPRRTALRWASGKKNSLSGTRNGLPLIASAEKLQPIAPETRCYVTRIKMGRCGAHYRVRMGSPDGLVIVESSTEPMLAGCRALLAMGRTGQVELWDTTRAFARMKGEIERLAGLTVDEGDRFRFRRYRPPPGGGGARIFGKSRFRAVRYRARRNGHPWWVVHVNAVATIPKLDKLIPLLGSDKDGGALAAARGIGRALRKAGLDWHDLARLIAKGTKAHRQGKPVKAASDLELAQFCYGRRSDLEAKERDFIRSALRLLAYGRSLSPRQTDWLHRIYTAVGGKL